MVEEKGERDCLTCNIILVSKKPCINAFTSVLTSNTCWRYAGPSDTRGCVDWSGGFGMG